MDDQGIYDAAMEEWMCVLAQLWEAIDKPLDTKRLKIYRNQLDIVPLGLLDKSVKRVIREHNYSNIPPTGTIWQAVKKELSLAGYDPGPKGEYLDEALEHWNNGFYARAVYQFA